MFSLPSRPTHRCRPQVESLEVRLNPAPALDFAFGMGSAASNFNGDQGRTIASDASGNAYIAGYLTGTVDFDPGPGTTNLTSANGTNDAFIAKYNAAGNLVWARQLTSPYDVNCHGIAVDA